MPSNHFLLNGCIHFEVPDSKMPEIMVLMEKWKVRTIIKVKDNRKIKLNRGLGKKKGGNGNGKRKICFS